MRADPLSRKSRENKAGQCVLGLDAHAPDAAQVKDAAGRLAAAQNEVGVQRCRPYKLSWDAVECNRYRRPRVSPIRGCARA